MQSAVMNMSGLLYLKLMRIGQFFSIKSKKKKAVLANPLVVFVVVVAVIFIVWALGELLCWKHGKSHFVFSSKIKNGVFRLGCR